jgi:hypothetical protein
MATFGLVVAQTRADLNVYRRTFPMWASAATDRGLLSWCHDRAWAHLTRLFDGVSEVSFVDQPPPPTLDGMEEIRLVAGYRWDPVTREIGSGILSLRDGNEKVVWSHVLDEPDAGRCASCTLPPLPAPVEEA